MRRVKGRRDIELLYCCYGLILTRTEWQERASSSWFLLPSFRPKLVTQCEFKEGLRWSVFGLLQALISSPTTGVHVRESIYFGQKAVLSTSYFKWLVFGWVSSLYEFAVPCDVSRRRMRWDSLARKRSQVISVEGSSHVALLKIKLHWRDCTEGLRHVWTQGVYCH